MSEKNLKEYAQVTENGSILLGKNTVVDGFHPGREIGIFSHIHEDHTRLFTDALHNCSLVYTCPATFDMLAALEQDEKDTVSADCYFNGRHIHRLDPDKTLTPRLNVRELNAKNELSDSITLKNSHHMLGSAQILVTTDDNVDIVYSGDFAYPETEPIKCDVLVLDATHGSPMFNAVVEHDSLENTLCELVKQEIEATSPVCIRSHVGRLQYTMSLLSERIAENVKFLSPSKRQRKLIPIYKKYKMNIREVLDSDSWDGDEILSGKFPFVEFKSLTTKMSEAEMSNRSTVFWIGGQGNLGSRTVIKQSVNEKTGKIDEKKYRLEFGDHGNYDGILNYVKKCEPSLVITDNYRSAWGKTLADRINEMSSAEKLGIEAISQP